MFAPITARILLDSITEGGSRLTTWELCYPRMIHAEIMTHRALSRNAASSRAIPAAKLRSRVVDLPAGPVHWGANQKGMQAAAEVEHVSAAQAWWLRGRDSAAALHTEGEKLGLHKQIVNRVIEPWMTITIICSATDWANFFHLRNHPAAEPNFQHLAKLMWNAYTSSLPVYRHPGEWHLPMTREDDVVEAQRLIDAKKSNGDDTFNKVVDILKQVSVGRCARVSYLTHEGKRDLVEDVRLHDQLAATANSDDPMHASPFEHVASAVGGRRRMGNFEGWRQYRKDFPKEAGPNTDYGNRCERCGMWNGQHVVLCPHAR